METYHLIGIGGAGMSGLARVLHSRGIRVTGSDMAASPTLDALESELGETLSVGHSAEHIGSPDLVVVSAAIKETNPELAAAREKGIPVASRAETLGKVMDLYPVRIAVSGTHGKTTTSAMIAQMLEYAGVDPTALIGSDVPAWQSNTRIGKSDIVVAEACEAYGSFLELRPTHSIITNIEADHLDYYADFQAIVDAFDRFVEQTTSKVFVCADGGADKLLKPSEKVVTYGIESGSITAEIRDDGEFAVYQNRKLLGKIALQVPGRHNVLNALSAVALGLEVGLNWNNIAGGLASFSGTSRRFEVLGETPNGAIVIDDYAHHPTEIRATLAAARAKYPGRRIVALFQPHLPSRTRDLMGDFAASFGEADLVLITDIYLAREQAMDGVTAERLADETAKFKGEAIAKYAGNLDNANELLAEIVRASDVVLTLGAGSVRKVGESLVGSKIPVAGIAG